MTTTETCPWCDEPIVEKPGYDVHRVEVCGLERRPVVVVPVKQCSACGFTYYDEEGERLMDSAVKIALDAEKRRNNAEAR